MFLTNMIYLDNAATTKVSDEVINEMINYYSLNFANSSSKHVFGKHMNSAVELSRKMVARMINGESSEICFNSGSTEGINTAIRGFVESYADNGSHIITTKVEHKAVLETCSYLESIGFEITYLDVCENGLVDIGELESLIRTDTILVSILWVNNETGVVQDLSSISAIVNKTNAKLFVDGTQAVGKLEVDVKLMGIDMMCFSAHKFHGPKGVGALYVNKGLSIKPLFYGGGQEKGLRSGTTNVPGIIGLAKACEIADFNTAEVEKVISYLESKICEVFDCKIIGDKSKRSPYISNILFKGIDADVIIGMLKNTIVSTGSACNSEINEPSHVLKHMNIKDEDAYGAIRFSISKETSIKDIDEAVVELTTVINPLLISHK